MIYDVATGKLGKTRRVPSFGPVDERDVQPCHGRNIEQALL